MNVEIYRAASRYTSDHGWLKTSHSFSFADYYDPQNLRFGPLRVLNDDIVQPGEGFGRHPHREMEIVSIVLRGQLEHTDSTGNSEIIHPGEIQRMSAGTGVFHSEMNPSASEEVNFLQLWFEPAARGVQPSYEQIAYPADQMANRLLPVVSAQGGPHTARINQDLTLYLSRLEAGQTMDFAQSAERKTFLFVMEGDLDLGVDGQLNQRDSARIADAGRLELRSAHGAFFMLIDLPA